jgi:hypothetical protein
MVIFSSQYTQYYYTSAASIAQCYTTVNTQNNNTMCKTKYEFNLKSLRSQVTACTDKDHMVILHHLEWQFVTVACEQVHDFKW